MSQRRGRTLVLVKFFKEALSQKLYQNLYYSYSADIVILELPDSRSFKNSENFMPFIKILKDYAMCTTRRCITEKEYNETKQAIFCAIRKSSHLITCGPKERNKIKFRFKEIRQKQKNGFSEVALSPVESMCSGYVSGPEEMEMDIESVQECKSSSAVESIKHDHDYYSWVNFPAKVEEEVPYNIFEDPEEPIFGSNSRSECIKVPEMILRDSGTSVGPNTTDEISFFEENCSRNKQSAFLVFDEVESYPDKNNSLHQKALLLILKDAKTGVDQKIVDENPSVEDKCSMNEQYIFPTCYDAGSSLDRSSGLSENNLNALREEMYECYVRRPLSSQVVDQKPNSDVDIFDSESKFSEEDLFLKSGRNSLMALMDILNPQPNANNILPSQVDYSSVQKNNEMVNVQDLSEVYMKGKVYGYCSTSDESFKGRDQIISEPHPEEETVIQAILRSLLAENSSEIDAVIQDILSSEDAVIQDILRIFHTVNSSEEDAEEEGQQHEAPVNSELDDPTLDTFTDLSSYAATSDSTRRLSQNPPTRNNVI